MKNTGILLLILGIFTQTLNHLSVSVNYLFNKEYITQNYCINKSKPEKKCFGKCHLKKVFTQVENNDTGNPKSDLVFQLVWQISPGYTCKFKTLELSPTFPINRRSENKPFTFSYLFQPVFTFFHPPPLLASF